MVGIILGDAHFRREGENGNARILFGQSLKNFPYLWYVSTLLSPYCASVPYLDSSVIDTVRRPRVIFSTRTYIVFSRLYGVFIVKGVKIVPQEIYHLLSPIALAHWIMCDGAAVNQGGLLLCTDGFSVKEVCRLMNVLIIRYGFVQIVHFNFTQNCLESIFLNKIKVN